MKSISFSESMIEGIRNHLKSHDTLHVVRVSSEYGKYKKGEFVKSSWGERFILIDITQIKDFNHLEKEYIHYKELKRINLEEIEKVANYKKIEILKLKKVDNKRVY
jgi:hypothetical protein